MARLDLPAVRDRLRQRLAEPAPGRIQLLAGPRQIAKTTLLLELAASHRKTTVYAAADGPEAAVPGFWERLWFRAQDVASREGRAIVLLDEAHLLHDWSRRLKGEWDRLRRRAVPIHIVATGSSALRLAAGSRESLAARRAPHAHALDGRGADGRVRPHAGQGVQSRRVDGIVPGRVRVLRRRSRGVGLPEMDWSEFLHTGPPGASS